MGKFSDRADFEVQWHPFQLAPGAPGGKGVNKLEMYKQKFGEQRVKQMLPHMASVGQREGISFSYGGNVGNTFDSHRLISLAGRQGRQDALVEALFRAYFEQERCISDPEVLLDAARSAGVAGAEEALAGDEEAAAVRDELARYQGEMRISGVPHFIIGGRQESGALESGQFQEIFHKLLA
mmetsp:Transcript_91414/g.258862  ORF Transcript_91414/g.258862 Transcript_91414/m.258862 type:complete len:181 (-) Transcript_91414:38-580(-)